MKGRDIITGEIYQIKPSLKYINIRSIWGHSIIKFKVESVFPNRLVKAIHKYYYYPYLTTPMQIGVIPAYTSKKTRAFRQAKEAFFMCHNCNYIRICCNYLQLPE